MEERDKRESKGGERENYSEKNPQAMDKMDKGESLDSVCGNSIFMRLW